MSNFSISSFFTLVAAFIGAFSILIFFITGATILFLNKINRPAEYAVVDADTWQICHPIIPRRTLDGGWTSIFGQTYRKPAPKGWVYKQVPEEQEE